MKSEFKGGNCMLEVMRQEEDYQHGNDCLIKDCFTVIKCHEKYIVMNIRRYVGWCGGTHK